MSWSYLHKTVVPRLRQSCKDNVRRDLFNAAAVLCELVGWMAYLRARHTLAQRYFIQALRFAEEAGDRAYAAYILASMAHEALFLERPDQGLRLAQVARDTGAKAGVPMSVTEACMYEARAYAAQGATAACIDALGRAEKSFSQAVAAELPWWGRQWTEIVFASNAGTCLVAIGKPDEAESFLRLLWESARDQARRRVYAATQLARVAVLRGDLEQACAFGMEAVKDVEGLASRRSVQQVVDLRGQLAKHARHPAVREFDERARLLVAA